MENSECEAPGRLPCWSVHLLRHPLRCAAWPPADRPPGMGAPVSHPAQLLMAQQPQMMMAQQQLAQQAAFGGGAGVGPGPGAQLAYIQQQQLQQQQQMMMMMNQQQAVGFAGQPAGMMVAGGSRGPSPTPAQPAQQPPSILQMRVPTATGIVAVALPYAFLAAHPAEWPTWQANANNIQMGHIAFMKYNSWARESGLGSQLGSQCWAQILSMRCNASVHESQCRVQGNEADG